MIVLKISTKESIETKEEWERFALEKSDLRVEFEEQNVGDYNTNLVTIEVKMSIDDFIASAIDRVERKDGTLYERLNSQLDRLIADPRPVKVFLLIGDIEDRISDIHRNSVHGFMAKICCKGNINDCLATRASMNGVNFVKLTDEDDWMDFIYRIVRLSEKYKKQLMK